MPIKYLEEFFGFGEKKEDKKEIKYGHKYIRNLPNDGEKYQGCTKEEFDRVYRIIRKWLDNNYEILIKEVREGCVRELGPFSEDELSALGIKEFNYKYIPNKIFITNITLFSDKNSTIGGVIYVPILRKIGIWYMDFCVDIHSNGKFKIKDIGLDYDL